MENITKALLIAAGVLIAIMLVTLIITFKDQLSAYFTEEHDSKMVEQAVEFNNRFENYNGQDIRGNELISVMNRVIDYNNTSAGVEGYDPVVIRIDFKGYHNDAIGGFKNDQADPSIFTSSILSNSSGSDADIMAVANLSTTLVNNSGIDGITDTKLQKLSASISTILDDSNPEYREKTLKNILGYEVTDASTLNKIKNATKQYYQYTQFKRAMFHCTGVKYNTENQRVNEITFDIVEENGKVKFN